MVEIVYLTLVISKLLSIKMLKSINRIKLKRQIILIIDNSKNT